MNLAQSIRRSVPSAIAVSGCHGDHTYGVLDMFSGRIAHGLRDLGVAVGDRVAVVMPNSVSHIAVYFAIARGGHTVVSVNPKSTAAEFARAFALTEPSAVIAAAEVVPAVSEAARRVGLSVPMIIDRSEGDGECGEPHAALLAELTAEEVDEDIMASVGPQAPAAILFTSGSTGKPRGVVLTHGNVMWAASMQAERMGAAENDVVALVAPMHHCFGQNAVMNAAFTRGGRVVLFDPRRSRRLVDDLARFEVTAVPGVPALFRVLLDLGAGPERLRRLRYAMSAATYLPLPTAQAWRERFGFPIHEGYGLTETAPCALYNDKRTSPNGSLGRPFQGVSAQIIDDAGRIVAQGETGELLLRGPNVMQGYYADPQATARALHDGWLRTGDQVRQDADGNFFMAGRRKSVIIVSGSNVFPSEVESVLLDHPGVAAAAVIGVPHRILGESVMAFVEAALHETADSLPTVLRRYCASQLAVHKRPMVIRVIESIPALATGKPDLEQLRRLASLTDD